MTNRIENQQLPAYETQGRSEAQPAPSAVPAQVLWESAEFDGVHFLIASYKPTGMNGSVRPQPLDAGAEFPPDSRPATSQATGLPKFAPESGLLRFGWCFWCREDQPEPQESR